MPRRDSVEKVVESYFAAVAARPFVYGGLQYDPPTVLSVPTTILRGFTCPSGCGGCCPTFTLDYLPEPLEQHPYALEVRHVDFDGQLVELWSDLQADNRDTRCRNLNRDDGRCGIHGRQPFSCDFELLGVTHRQSGTTTLTTRLFARGWNMHRVDGGVGALCELIPATEEWAVDVVRRLKRLEQWADHFGLETSISAIVRWIDAVADDVIAGRDVDPLRLTPQGA